MRKFTALVSALEQTSSARQKTALFSAYLASGTDEADVVWTLHLLGGKKPEALCSPRRLMRLLDRCTAIPAWLIDRCRRETGEVTETVSLLANGSRTGSRIGLYTLMNEIETQRDRTVESRDAFIQSAWENLTAAERYLFNKIVTGTFKSPLRGMLLGKCVADVFKTDRYAVTYRLTLNRHPETTSLSYYTVPPDDSEKRLIPRPFPPHPKEITLKESPGNPEDWYYYPYYKGIRCHIVYKSGHVLIWTSQGELLPEYESLTGGIIRYVADNSVLDAVLTNARTGIGLHIHDLQEYDGRDLRNEPLEKRSQLLNRLDLTGAEGFHIVPGKPVGSWREMHSLMREMQAIGAQGILLKQRDAPYPSEHPVKRWVSIQADPHIVIAVLLYIEYKPENGPEDELLCTFAVRSGETLVPFAKTASGIDKRMREIIDQFAAEHTVERFGPVRQVRPGLVFEIAFESVEPSHRHKSGLTVSSPRVHRYLPGKTVRDIDTVESLRKLIVIR
jgi:DNA ligase 1